MENKNLIKQDGYQVVGPISQQDLERTKPILAKLDRDAGSHYESAIFDANIVMHHLVHRCTGTLVGFVSTKMQLEHLGDDCPANAFFAIEYVYVLPEYRGIGLGDLLLRATSNLALTWLHDQRESCIAGIICMSSSHPISRSGLRLCQRLDVALNLWCHEHSVTFMTSTMPA